MYADHKKPIFFIAQPKIGPKTRTPRASMARTSGEENLPRAYQPGK